MTLEAFEKDLAEEKTSRVHRASRHKNHHEKQHRYHRHRHYGEDEDHHKHKRRKRSSEKNTAVVDDSSEPSNDNTPKNTYASSFDPTSFDATSSRKRLGSTDEHLKRDSWMQEPSGHGFDFTQRGVKKPIEVSASRTSKADFELRIHRNELNKDHLANLAAGRDIPEKVQTDVVDDEIKYIFGDAGASWRMTKLKGVYRRVQENDMSLDDAALEQYGDLKLFDHAREEQIELDRRETYGDGYARKEKPSGELFSERRRDASIEKAKECSIPLEYTTASAPRMMETTAAPTKTIPMDQSALNRLKATMMKAKLKGGLEAAHLEEEYNASLAIFTNQKQPDVVVLGAVDNRMLAGSRKGEVRSVDNKRGRERGLVEENEDMALEDMVREERRTKGEGGGDGRRFAERIAKDARFDNDLEYLDANAAKLAKRVQKSDINLRNIAISDFQKINRLLDTCPLCHHEDTDKPPLAPILSLGTRVYLTLPTEPEISDGGACIIPIQHRDNLLYCDDDEWEEIRNFMKSLTRMYHDQGRDVIFYENAAAPHRKKHAALEVVPLPYELGETAPAFFKESILTADEEWTQHKKIIDTLAKAKNGVGKTAFRRTLVKEMPYFHVWFEIDGGLGHIVEDSNRWPKGDLFAREVIGGMLDKGPEVIKRQGKWSKGKDPRTDDFQRRWRKFDWTRVLHDN